MRVIKFLILPVALGFMAIGARAEGKLPDYSPTKLKDFLAKEKPCLFAVGSTNQTLQQLDAAIARDPDKWPMNPYVMCVGDFTDGKGTIKEKFGCAFRYYDTQANTYSNPSSVRETLLVEGVRCKDEKDGKTGFERLREMTYPITNPYDMFSTHDTIKLENRMKVPLLVWLTDYGHRVFGHTGKMVLYSESPDWATWWKTQRDIVDEKWAEIHKKDGAKAAARVKAERERKKSEAEQSEKTTRDRCNADLHYKCKEWSKIAQAPAELSSLCKTKGMEIGECMDMIKNGILAPLVYCQFKEFSEFEKRCETPPPRPTIDIPFVDG